MKEFKLLGLASSHGCNGFAATALLIQLVTRMGRADAGALPRTG